MNITIFKDLFKSNDVPFVVPIESVIDRIKNGTSKNIIEKIRGSQNKDERDGLKKRLPAILFSGEFTERNKNGCKSHSGLMITDFDKMPHRAEYDRILDELKSNPHVFMAFMSPSGDKGLKAVVRIPKCSSADHTRYFKKFNEEFNIDYWDNSNSDISRVCFESYDPDIYVNTDAVEFAPVLEDEGYNTREYVSYTPLTDEGQIIDRIMSWNWSRTFVDGQRNDFVFDLAGVFCEFGIHEETACNYILNNVVIGDFSEKEARNTIKNAYKKRQRGTRAFEDFEKKKQLKKDIIHKKKDEVLLTYGITEDEYNEIKADDNDDTFWYYVESKSGERIQIDNYRYKVFLERNGFKKYFHNDAQKPTLVKVQSNKVEETSSEKIKDFVLNYLMVKNKIDVWNYMANYQNLFTDSFFVMLETIDLVMLSDTKTASFIAFNNGILKTTKNDVELIDYIDVNGYIWANQIIKHDFTISNDIENEYKQFISNIAGEGVNSFESVIGYLCRTYKNKMNNRAVILNDEVISDNPEGGTGKGLFAQGLRQVRRVSILDGKTFDDKKSFPYQTVTPETQILVFDDVKKNWDFESKFSLVTEGMTLERKNKDAIKLTVEESPKILVSTNYAIRGEGNSHDRRRFELEVAQYYGKNFTPYDEFGHQLFDDWDTDHFNRFYNYIVKCIQLYLSKGLITQEAKNIKLRKFIAETSLEFSEWISDTDNFPLNTRNEKLRVFDHFISDYEDYKRYLTRKKFTIWIQKYASFINMEYRDGNSNGIRWCEITNESVAKSVESVLDDDDFAF